MVVLQLMGLLIIVWATINGRPNINGWLINREASLIDGQPIIREAPIYRLPIYRGSPY